MLNGFNHCHITPNTGSRNPAFGRTFEFPVLMSPDLDEYLRNEPLQLFVLDDNDTGMLHVVSSFVKNLFRYIHN